MGPPFKSHEIKQYMKKKGIRRHRITPLWPRANEEIERFMLPLVKTICTAYIENNDWQQQVYDFLMAYRITPHTATKVAPADLMYQRKIRHSIPDVDTTVNKTELNEHLESNDHMAKLQAKVYKVTRTHAKPNTLQVGDRVLVKQRKLHKITPRFNTNPYYITDMKGTSHRLQSYEPP